MGTPASQKEWVLGRRHGLYHWALDWGSLVVLRAARATAELSLALFIPVWRFVLAVSPPAWAASGIEAAASLDAFLTGVDFAGLCTAFSGLFSPGARLGFSRLQQVEKWREWSGLDKSVPRAEVLRVGFRKVAEALPGLADAMLSARAPFDVLVALGHRLCLVPMLAYVVARVWNRLMPAARLTGFRDFVGFGAVRPLAWLLDPGSWEDYSRRKAGRGAAGSRSSYAKSDAQIEKAAASRLQEAYDLYRRYEAPYRAEGIRLLGPLYNVDEAAFEHGLCMWRQFKEGSCEHYHAEHSSAEYLELLGAALPGL